MPPDRAAFLSREKRDGLAVALFFVAVACALFWPALLFHRALYGWDTLTVTIPFDAELRRNLAAHQWPLWMPDVLGGMPGIASCNIQFLYPTDFIGCLSGLSLSTMDALDSFLHVVLAGLGMFLFLRRLGRSASGALLGAFFFAVSGSVVSQIFGGYYCFLEAIPLVPWAFWAAHKGSREGSLFAWGLCGLAFALQILAQATQIFVYTLPAVVTFVLLLDEGPKPGSGTTATPKERFVARLPAVGGLALALGLCFLLAAPQVWPTLQYLPLAARHGYSHAEFIAGSISPAEAIDWFVPGYFGWQMPTYHGAMGDCEICEYFGLLPWILAGGALAALWRRESAVRWMSALAACAFFLAQRLWTPFYAPFQHLPILAGLRIWSRALFLVAFAVCALAAFGWDALRAQASRTKALRGACASLGLILAVAGLAWALAPAQAAGDVFKLSGRGFPVDPGSVAAGLTGLARDSACRTLELCLGAAALLFFFARGLRPGPALALVLALSFQALDQKPVIDRFVTYMDPRTEAASPRFRQAPPQPPGVEPWRIDDGDISYPNNNILLGYENLAGRESVPLQSRLRIEQAMAARRQDWARLMNVRYFFLHSRRGSSDPADTVTIYENRGAFPRAWLVGRSVAVSGDEAAYGLLAEPGFNPRSTVALETDAGLNAGPLRGGVRWLARSPQDFSLAVSTDKAAALVVSNAWYPSWKAEVDGRDTPVLKADGGLQALLLAPGEHQVDFRFDSGLFDDALAACLAGLLFLMGLALRERTFRT